MHACGRMLAMLVPIGYAATKESKLIPTSEQKPRLKRCLREEEGVISEGKGEPRRRR